MNTKRRIEGFTALVNHDKANNYYLEEPDGNHRLWKDLSAQARLGYIASAAALYDVPFNVFSDVVRNSVDRSMLMEAALQTVLRNAIEFRSLGRLLPDDGRTESTPLTDRFREILNLSSASRPVPDQSKDRSIER